MLFMVSGECSLMVVSKIPFAPQSCSAIAEKVSRAFPDGFMELEYKPLTNPIVRDGGEDRDWLRTFAAGLGARELHLVRNERYSEKSKSGGTVDVDF